jgi:hypothetical protein
MQARLFMLVALFASPALSQVPSTVKDPFAAGMALRPEQRQFALHLRQLQPSRTITVDSTGRGLQLDLLDSALYGRVHAGQAYFEHEIADEPEVMFRTSTDIVNGRAVIPLRTYFDSTSRSNANGWVNSGILGYRLEITTMKSGRPVNAGIFDSRVYFRLKDSLFHPIVSIIEPPMVALIQSDHPEWMVVSFTADRPCQGLVEVEKLGLFVGDAAAERHEIRVSGLRPATGYRYRAFAVAGDDTAFTPWFRFTSAPVKGEGSVVFAYAGDGRASAGGGEFSYVGVNRQTGTEIARQIFRHRAAFLLFGGDLAAGYTNSLEELQMELMAFRGTYASYLSSQPLYAGTGNHEALANAFEDGSRWGLTMDKWPYESSSAEAMFAKLFIHPSNGPKAVPGRPPYDETAYAFQYGPVKVIVLNTNYWYTSHNRIPEYGGSPEGYILPEQMEWIKEEVRRGDADPTVRSMVMLAHEPVFPGGGHVGDAMWHRGNNNRRAYTLEGGKAEPVGPGIVEMRNELWKTASQSRKVAVVLGSDEHNYQRYLITRNTPVGIPAKDDLNGNGILDDGRFSANPDFARPLWFAVSGGAGAPYYTREAAPWSGSSKFFSAQHSYIIFRADRKKIGMEVYSESGQLLDRVDDLMGVKR